jgi:hypothetical protein
VSPDSSRLAYVVRIGDKQAVVTDGRTGKAYDVIDTATLAFSRDGTRLAYVARVGRRAPS